LESLWLGEPVQEGDLPEPKTAHYSLLLPKFMSSKWRLIGTICRQF
jgi:hypothetical protein